MSCACLEKEKITPLDTCLECVYKHLSYANVLEEDSRKIGQIYLAYKHIEKGNAEFATSLFKIIEKYLKESKLNNDEIYSNILKLENIRIDEEKENLNLEEKYLNEDELEALYLIAVNELIKEIGYEKINKPFIIGYLQKAADISKNNKNIIRNIWKIYFKTNEFMNIDEIIFRKLQYLIRLRKLKKGEERMSCSCSKRKNSSQTNSENKEEIETYKKIFIDKK